MKMDVRKVLRLRKRIRKNIKGLKTTWIVTRPATSGSRVKLIILNKKKSSPPTLPVLPHEGSLDSYEDRHPSRQGASPPAQDLHHSRCHREPASPSKLLKRHRSTSNKRGYDNYRGHPWLCVRSREDLQRRGNKRWRRAIPAQRFQYNHRGLSRRAR